MAYDDTLARRVRTLLAPVAGVDERAMFGGLAFLDRGHMACGLVGDELMVRVGEAGYADALRQPHARPMDFTGRPLKGMIYVSAAGIADDAGLRGWIERGFAFTRTQPAKVAKPRANKVRAVPKARKASAAATNATAKPATSKPAAPKTTTSKVATSKPTASKPAIKKPAPKAS